MLTHSLKHSIFLLGGYDLEMLEIKKLLLKIGFQENVNLFDKQLMWGAKLSEYHAELERFGNTTPFKIYGIELEETQIIRIPNNYIRIDHHNDFVDKPASILQIAALASIKPSRYIKLVAANDAGYKPAMRAIGATEDEIDDIRQQDRKAQGVTEEMELAAEDAIKNAKYVGRLVVIESKFSLFSPITDRVDFENYLIFNDDEATFFGNKIDNLKHLFREWLEQKRVYYGKVFFGFPKGSFNEGVLNIIINFFKDARDI